MKEHKPIYIGFTPEQAECIRAGKRLVFADPQKRNRGACPNLTLIGGGGFGDKIECLDKTADMHCPKKECRGIPTKECIDVVNPYGAY
jgi:hypothetical protein